MTTTNFFSKVGFVLAIAAVFVLPQISLAASYAYVNTMGNVSMVVASDANTAIATAPNRDFHSGVLLLVSSSDFNLVD